MSPSLLIYLEISARQTYRYCLRRMIAGMRGTTRRVSAASG
jgi:hypothetical protein